MEASSEQEAEEFEAIEKACDFLKGLLDAVKTSGVSKLSDRSRKKLGNMRQMFVEIGDAVDKEESGDRSSILDLDAKEKKKRQSSKEVF